MLLAADVANYWFHRASHENKWLFNNMHWWVVSDSADSATFNAKVLAPCVFRGAGQQCNQRRWRGRGKEGGRREEREIGGERGG